MMPSMPIGGGGGQQSVDFGGGGPSEARSGNFSGGTVNYTPPRSIQQAGQNNALIVGAIGLAVVGALWAWKR